MIIPFFLPNQGCPQRCIFCNAQALADTEVPNTETSKMETPDNEEAFHTKVMAYLQAAEGTKGEIAFYGANFTGMNEDKQARLLGWAAAYQQKGLVKWVRISTRPDYISPETVDFLSQYGVGVVEIGAQALDDDVLAASGRGHTARDVSKAVSLLKAKGIRTSLHLMVGLPSQTSASFLATVERALKINPAMVRLHPTLVFADTPLAKLYQNGAYSPLSLEDAISLCKAATRLFIAHGIAVIRLGLQIAALPGTPCYPLAGPYHPAFGALVYERLVAEAALERLAGCECHGRAIIIGASAKDVNFLQARCREWCKRFGLKTLEVEAYKQQRRGSVTLEIR